MIFTLIKCSSPGWEKDFSSKEQLIDALRDCICDGCLIGPPMYVGDEGKLVPMDDDYSPVIDTEYEGKKYYCRDIGTLLSTSCGCEYYVEIDGKSFYEA